MSDHQTPETPDRETLVAMTRQDLIAMARHRFAGQVSPNLWVGTKGLTRDVLIDAILSGQIPEALADGPTPAPEAAPDATRPEPPARTRQAPTRGDLDLGIISEVIRRTVEDAIAGHAPDIDEDRVRGILIEELEKITLPRRMAVKQGEAPEIVIENAHEAFPTVLCHGSAMVKGRHRGGMYLWGPVGTGKTHLAVHLAEALGARLRTVSLCTTTSATNLLGYTDATGNYHPTPVYEAFRDAAQGIRTVLCFDEFDNGSPAILPVLNTALSNGWLTFPNGDTIKISRDLVIIATANTSGHGATLEHIGRMKQDAATLDRFTFLHVAIDERLETAIATAIDPTWGPRWAARVQAWRRGIDALQIRHTLSPRASYSAASISAEAAEMGLDDCQIEAMVETTCIWKALPAEQIDKVKEASPKAKE